MFSSSSQPPSSSSQPRTSFFGGTLGTSSTTQPQTTTSGLFSSLGTSTASSQPPPPRNLFSSLGSSQPASSQGTSLFNNPPASTQPQQPILGFGATQAPASQFSHQNNPPEVKNPNHQAASQPAFFDTLLERSRQRNKDVNGISVLEELPSLQLGLGDIARRVKELGGAGLAGQQGKVKVADKAHYILAASGISTGAALRDLNALNAQASSAAAASVSRAVDTDVDTYLSKIQSQSTLALIADGLNRSARDFDAFLEKNVTMEWDAQRQRIYEHFGLGQRNTGVRGDENDLYSGQSSAKGGFGRPARRGRNQGESVNRSTATGGGSVFGASTISRSVIGSSTTGGLGQLALFADLTDKTVSTQLSSSGTPGDRFLREKQTLFAQTVGRLSQARLENKVFPVLAEFASAELKSSGDPTSSQLADAYKALIEVVKENPNATNPADPDAVKERQLTSDYLDENPNSAKSIGIKKRIIDGSRTFLEKRQVIELPSLKALNLGIFCSQYILTSCSFYQQLEGLIAKHPKEARLGGIPTVLNKVRAYINLRNSKKDLVPENVTLQMLGSDYVWALIFYLLRSGHARDAAEFVTNNAAPFRNIDRNFVTYITDYVSSKDRRLRREFQDRINAEYSQRQRIAPEDSIDPFRMACYKVIGRCDLNKRSLEGISQDVDDWIWLQFSLAREVNRVDEVAGEVFGLDELRVVIKEIGQRHFAKGQEAASGGIGTYFFLQVLAGMFEQAISYLYPYQYIDAVHFAIALDFYGLLRVSNFNSSDSELLTFNTKELPQIDFGRMVGYYTRDFRAENVEAAVDYLTLICLNADLPGEAGRSQASLCHGALRELVLETREFARLLGDVRADGIRISGAIEQRLRIIKLADQEEFLRMVTKQAAGVADDNGRVTDAVLLYHLAEDYDNVVSIINKTLSEAIATDFGQEQLKLQPLKPRATPTIPGQSNELEGSSLSLTSVDDPAVLARNMVGLYNSNAMYFQKISQANRDACGVLLRMSEAKALVEGGHWAAALDIIKSLGILPLSAAGDVYQVRSAAHAFPSFHPTVARNVGNLLMWTITCCGRQRDLLRASNFDDATKRTMAEALLVQARDLMVYAGMIKYKLPPNVYEALARAGQEVGAY